MLSLRVLSDASDLIDWWLRELRGMLPAGVRQRFGRRDRHDYLIVVAKDFVRLRHAADAVVVEIPSEQLTQQLPKHIAKPTRQKRATFELILEPGRYLERPLGAFRLPKRRARDMAAIDVQSATPLDPSDAITMFTADERRPSGHRYFIVKRQVLEPLIRVIESASGEVSRIGLQTDQGLLEMDRDGYRHLIRSGRRHSYVRNLTVAGLTACLVGAIATLAHAQWRYSDGLRQLDAAIEALDRDVKEVRALSERRKREIEQIANVRAQKQQAIPLTGIWEELSRVIPDNAWLTDLSINRSKITVTGVSSSAAALIGALEASTFFREPTFTTPVVKSPDSDGERFTIDMELQR